MRSSDYISLLTVPEAFAADFDGELAEKRVVGLWVLAVLGAVLFPLFIGMDYLLRPAEILDLGEIRFVVACLSLLLLLGLKLFQNHPLITRHSLSLTWCLTLIFAAGIDTAIIAAGGLGTPYYAGLNLLIIVIATAVPMRTLQLTALLLCLVVQVNIIDYSMLPQRNPDLVITANYHLLATLLLGLLINAINQHLRLTQFRARHQLQAEKVNNEALLFSAMPERVAQEYLNEGRYAPRHVANCSVLFSDFVGFTRLASRITPSELVHGLDRAFTQFDDVSHRYGLERIKTMGDSYMCAGGVLAEQPDHLVRSVLVGLEMLDIIEREGMRGPDGTPWRMRIGIHVGPVVAGVVGRRNFAFDLWGDAVNVASRMESHAEPGAINVATATYDLVEQFFLADDRGSIPVRGKGPIAMSLITRLRPRYSLPENGRLPNEDFYKDLEAWLTAQGTQGPNPLAPVEIHDGQDVSVSDFDPLNAFAMLVPADHERLSELGSEVPVREGEVLFREGQDLSVLYLVVRGLFAVRNRKSGVDIEVAVLGSGELIGELSFVSLEAASATVVAIADSAVLRFDLNRLQHMHTEHPGFSARLFHSFALRLARRVRVANAKLFKASDERAALESGGQGAMTSPHIPTHLVAAIGDLQRVLRPFLDGTQPESELPDNAVSRVADGLLKALADQALRKPEDIHEFGTAVRREAYRFLMRSKLIQLIQGQGLGSHPVMESIRRTHVLSKNPVGRQVEQWFYDQPFAMALLEAVEFTGEYLEHTYDKSAEVWRFCSLGQGSIDEIFDRIGQLGAPGNIRITYVNEHIEALSASGMAAEQLDMKDQVSLIRLNVLVRGMIRSRLRLVPQNLIVYQALIQSVPDEAILDLLDEVYALLAPDGIFLVGQVNLHEKSTLFLTHILDAPIYSRTQEELSELVSRSAFGRHFRWVTPGIGGLCSFLELKRSS